MVAQAVQYNVENLVTASDATRCKAKETQTAISRKVRLKHAVFVEDFAYEALTEMRESLSFRGETARDNGQAVASVIKAWDIAGERIRMLRGEPAPGNRKPLPDAPKKSKPKLRPGPKAPERPPATAAEVKPTNTAPDSEASKGISGP